MQYPYVHPQYTALLDQEVSRYVRKGYRVVARTATTAQLVRPKQFSCLLASLSLLAFGVGFLVYVFWYAAKSDDTVYLEIDPSGRIRRT